MMIVAQDASRPLQVLLHERLSSEFFKKRAVEGFKDKQHEKWRTVYADIYEFRRCCLKRGPQIPLPCTLALSCDGYVQVPRDFQERIEAGAGYYPHLHVNSHWHPI
jgi:hypothetical protein